MARPISKTKTAIDKDRILPFAVGAPQGVAVIAFPSAAPPRPGVVKNVWPAIKPHTAGTRRNEFRLGKPRTSRPEFRSLTVADWKDMVE